MDPPAPSRAVLSFDEEQTCRVHIFGLIGIGLLMPDLDENPHPAGLDIHTVLYPKG